MTISGILGLLVPIANLYLLFRIWRETKIAADAERRKDELNDNIRKFGAMFAAASGIPVPGKKKTVTFEAKSDE